MMFLSFWYYIMMTSFWYYVMTSYIPMIAWQTSVSLTGPGSSAYPSNVTIASSFGFSSNLYGVILNVLCFGVGGGFTFWNFTSFDFFGFNQSEAHLKNKKEKKRNRNYVMKIKIKTLLSELSILSCFSDWSLRRFFISCHAPMNL